MKIYITGHRGRLGSELVRQGCLPLCDGGGNETDILNLDALCVKVAEVQPDVIINCAAFTQVDACEDEATYEKILSFNLRGIDNLRRAFDRPLIHISSDYVFDGTKGPYTEKSRYSPNGPVNNYGWTKVGGEVAFLSNRFSNDMLIRTTGLYGRNAHHDFARLVINTLRDRKELRVSSQLRGNQTYIPHLAEALIYIAHRPDEFRDIPVLNIASSEVVSRYEFSLMIASVYGLDKRLLNPVRNDQIDEWIAKRPTQGGLKVALAKKMGVPIYTIRQGLEALYGENYPA